MFGDNCWWIIIVLLILVCCCGNKGFDRRECFDRRDEFCCN